MAIVFFDTEFTSLNKKSNIISIGLVSECGKSFYGVFEDYPKNVELSDFVKKEVLPNLNIQKKSKSIDRYRIHSNKSDIVNALTEWLNQFTKIQMWADVPHYDWVLFCELFGGALNIPDNINYVCLDLATLLFAQNIDVDIKRIELLNNIQSSNYKSHNALDDAKIGLKILMSILKK